MIKKHQNSPQKRIAPKRVINQLPIYKDKHTEFVNSILEDFNVLQLNDPLKEIYDRTAKCRAFIENLNQIGMIGFIELSPWLKTLTPSDKELTTALLLGYSISSLATNRGCSPTRILIAFEKISLYYNQWRLHAT
jgi:hypothetical protein